ncbi:DNA-dependent metalloprotease SPRTN-like [Topomyia yanbarensis]|uniref:DNA-dependent metalloprotease SPRTN-like n=1 Tax=Topomyia yanbarensis TaxID=2498891 RepID=UPI00273C67CA|nr:DNA-dependent metalloprotease SPRTN-like [Topomyia yanbarensis]XP_058825734.1 DNA-dependent metalloprotease SPRTN-like [Topomyia yanbarensis]
MTTTDLEDPDFLLARQLQDQFDRELVEVSSCEEDESGCQLVLASKPPQELVELSDNDDDVFLVVDIDALSATAKSAVVKEEVDESACEVKWFRAERSDLNADEYFIEELQTYVDPNNNFEWKFVQPVPDITSIFQRLDEVLFSSRFKTKRFAVIWSQGIGEQCTNRNFNDTDGRYTIALNETLLTLRPRIEIISILLHEMIHAFLKLEAVKESNNGHGANFRKMMIFLNRMLQTNISFSHRLINANTLCRTQWYRCTGICTNYKPFHGIVRSTEGDPGLQNEWWKTHAEDCGGTFYKVYEMSKIIEGEVSTRFAVNVKYMKPKRENIRGRYKTMLPPKESIDLTSDKPRVMSTMAETILLDDEGPSTEDTKAADKFIQNFNRSVALSNDSYDMQCPICQDRIKRKLFANHIDGCKGIIQRVNWRKPAGLVVQNGLQEHRVNLHQPESSLSFRNRRVGSSATISDYQRIKRQRFM